MPDKYERFVNAFLRLNGYFTVPNFIVHAADDPSRIFRGMVGNRTEVDTIAIRMPHSAEVTGAKQVVNYEPLTAGAAGRVDVVFAEAKSGRNNKPNRVWLTDSAGAVVHYLVRFVGHHDEVQGAVVATELARSYAYIDATSRYRYVIFASEPNVHYAEKGVSYITFRQAAEFLVRIRGESWIEAGLGVASIHQQWDELLTELFAIANDQRRSPEERIAAIENYLEP